MNCLTFKNWTGGPSWNVGNQLPTNAASHPRRGKTSPTLWRKPEISQSCKLNERKKMKLACDNSHENSTPWNILRPQTDDHQIMWIRAPDAVHSAYRYIHLRPPLIYTNQSNAFETKKVITWLTIPILYFAQLLEDWKRLQESTLNREQLCLDNVYRKIQRTALQGHILDPKYINLLHLQEVWA
jgi:hypothetical protein